MLSSEMTKYWNSATSIQDYILDGKPVLYTSERALQLSGFQTDDLLKLGLIRFLDINIGVMNGSDEIDLIATKPGEEWRADVIEEAIANVLCGVIDLNTYHRTLGHSLGYSPEDIDAFVATQSGDNSVEALKRHCLAIGM